MSKIICDICGTSYPDHANACPICGYPRKDSEKAAAEETTAAAAATTAAAASASSRSKGGRFSNKNVKKRNQPETPAETRRERRRRDEEPEPEEKGGNRGLVIAVVILAIAVLLVGAYIGWRFWDGKDAYDNPSAPIIGTNPSTETTEPETTVPADTGVPCAGMTVSDTSVEFLGAGRGWKLSISTTPENTTDELTFTSSDESVVTVTSDGRLTSVGPGSATITITCGTVTKECQVFCNFEEETEPSETTQPEETTEPEETTKPTENNTEGFKLDRSDVTLFSAGETFTFGVTNNGTYLNPANVEWSSEDTSIATVEGGKVTAVAEGKTTIVATYNGTKQECIIRCRFDNDETTETTEKTYTDSNWKISNTDVTLILGETFTLKVTNDAGETADVSWSSSNAGVVSISGNSVTAKVVGYTEVSATVDGETFTCIVRVIENR